MASIDDRFGAPEFDRRGRGDVRVRIDTHACQGHSRCALNFPEIFDVDDDAKAFVLVDNVGPEWAEKVQIAIANCPERAISLDSTEGKSS